MSAHLTENLSQDKVLQLIEDTQGVSLQGIIQSLDISELVPLLENSPPNYRAIIWKMLDDNTAAQVVQEINVDVSSNLLHALQPDEIASLLGNLNDDDLADVLQHLPETLMQTVLASMDEHDCIRAQTVLAYDPESAGGLMTTEIMTVGPDHTLEVVTRYLRVHMSAIPENLDNLLVVGRDHILLGSLSLVKLAILDQDLTVREVMETDSITPLLHTLSSTEVAAQFQHHNWLSAPVVDEQHHLLGRITVDDIVDVVREQADHALLNLGKVGDEEDTFSPMLKVIRSRTLWLGVNLITALMASSIIKLYEDTIAQVVTLAVLIPLIASMAGVAGIQTLTIVIRALALNQINRNNRFWLLRREFYVGAGNGLLWAMTMAVIASLWFDEVLIGVVIALAMVISLTAATMIGVVLPLALKRVGADPALSAGVLLTTFTDIIGFFSFLGLATWFYR